MIIEAIVIKKVPVREHDQLVVLYSRELGKCSAIAKSSLRPHSRQALALDEGNRIHCELVSGRSGYIVAGAQAAHACSDMKCSLVRWAAAQFFLQAIDVLAYDEQPDPHVWAALTEALAVLDTIADEDTLAVFRRAQGSLLSSLGYGSPTISATMVANRTSVDEQFEEIAQRRLTSLDLLYAVAGRRYS